MSTSLASIGSVALCRLQGDIRLTPQATTRAGTGPMERRLHLGTSLLQRRAAGLSPRLPSALLGLDCKPCTSHGRRGQPARQAGVAFASIQEDLPWAVAILACIAYTAVPLVFPLRAEEQSSSSAKKKDTAIFNTDSTRYTTMSIISFIPIFNWMTWVLGYLDKKDQRYLVFALIYALPYIRSGLMITPEDSWLPLFSVFMCVIHVTLDDFVSVDPPKPLLKKEQLSKITSAALWKEMSGLSKDLGKQLEDASAPKRSQPDKEESEDLKRLKELSDLELKMWDEAFTDKKKEEAKKEDEERR